MRDGSPRKPCGMILPPPAPRNRCRGKRRASPPPAEPSPFGNPLPGTPLHQRYSQRGRALLAQFIRSALGGRMLRGADPPRALRVTALANLCPCFAPVCPQRGRPGSKDKSKDERRNDGGIGFTPPLRSCVKRVYSSVTRRASAGTSRALAPARPRAGESACARETLRRTLPRSHPP